GGRRGGGGLVGCLEVDDWLVLGGLPSGGGGGLGSLGYVVEGGGGREIEIAGPGAVTKEPTRHNVLLKWEHARQAVLERERGERHALTNNQRRPHGQKSPDALLRHRRKRAVEVL